MSSIVSLKHFHRLIYRCNRFDRKALPLVAIRQVWSRGVLSSMDPCLPLLGAVNLSIIEISV